MAALAVIAIPVSDVVLFLGGVLRCRAPWFGRTQDRASQMSQGPSNNALLEVTVQLRLQYQELLDLQVSQQSVKGSVMAQACHTPATNSDASAVHPVADSRPGDG